MHTNPFKWFYIHRWTYSYENKHKVFKDTGASEMTCFNSVAKKPTIKN